MARWNRRPLAAASNSCGRGSESSPGRKGLDGHVVLLTPQSRGKEAGESDARAHGPAPAGSRDPGDSGRRAGPSPRRRGLLTPQLASTKAIRQGPRPRWLQGREPGAASQPPSTPPARLAGPRCSQCGQGRPAPRDTPSPLPLPRPAPLGLGAAPIGWACPLLAKRPLAIGHGSPAVGR